MFQYLNSITIANFAGLGAIVMWSMLAVLPLILKDLPIINLLLYAYTISCIIFTLIWISKYGRKIFQELIYRTNWSNIIINAILLLSTEITLIAAMQSGDHTTAYITLNAWPLFIILLNTLLFGQKLKFNHYISVICGFLGVITTQFDKLKDIYHNDTLINLDNNNTSQLCLMFGEDTVKAALFGLTNAVIWSLYSLYNSRCKGVPSDRIGVSMLLCTAVIYIIYLCGPDAPFYDGAHSLSQLTHTEIIALIALSIMPWCLAYIVWDCAMKYGDIRTISIYGYAMPVLGMILLIIFGYTEPSLPIALGTSLVVISSALASR